MNKDNETKVARKFKKFKNCVILEEAVVVVVYCPPRDFPLLRASQSEKSLKSFQTRSATWNNKT